VPGRGSTRTEVVMNGLLLVVAVLVAVGVVLRLVYRKPLLEILDDILSSIF